MQHQAATNLNIAAAISIIAVFGISLGLTVPVIALVLAENGYSSAAIGAHVSVQFLGLMLVSPLTPLLLVRFGTSRLMIYGLLSIAFIMASFAVFNSFLGWLLLRFFLGGIEAIIFISADTWINQIAPQEKRGKIIGLYATAISAGFGLGPFLLAFTGVTGATPFLVGAVIALVTVPILIATYGQPPRVELSSNYSQWHLARKVPIPILFTMLFGILFASAFGLLPVYGLTLNLTPDAAARLVGVFVLGGVVFQFPLGLIADEINRHNLLYISAAISALALLLVPLLWHVPIMLYLLIFLSGGLIGSFWTIPLMMFGDKFQGSDLAAVNSVSAILYGFGSTVGPSVVGACMLWSSHGLMFAMAAPTVGLAIATLMYQFLLRNQP
jgi:MFS family permease